jgi:hypothetical protein
MRGHRSAWELFRNANRVTNVVSPRCQRDGSSLVDASDKLFAGSIPEIDDRYLVPLIFEPYAVNVAAHVNQGGQPQVPAF